MVLNSKTTMLTCKEIAIALRLSISAATALVRSGRIPGINVAEPGKRALWRIPRENLEQFLAAGLPPRPPATTSLPPGVKRFV